jgi:Integrase core domain/HTH-like domain
VSLFRFIAAEKANHSISLMCRLLGVSRSGFHAWERRPPSDRALADAWLVERIKTIHRGSRGTYGARRIHAALAQQGVRVGRKRVERLMRTHRLTGAVPRKRAKTTIRVAGVRAADDLVLRNFKPSAANQLWVADIKYVPSAAGWLYLAVVVDCFSRRVVGWSMRDDLRAQLVIDALEMAVARRRPGPGLVHHSDQGSQGGFNWSSQHLVMGVVRDGCSGASAGGSCDAWPDVVAGPTLDCEARGSAAVLARDRSWALVRGGGRCGRGVAGGWRPVVPRRWRDAANLVGPAVGALSVVQ